jgi:hypothetical protein
MNKPVNHAPTGKGILIGILVGIGIGLCVIIYGWQSNDDSEEIQPGDRVIPVSNIDELNTVLLNKWRGKKVVDFVAEYGEPERKYNMDTYIWEDLVEVDEAGGVFTYDIWMDYYDNNILNFKLGSSNKK